MLFNNILRILESYRFSLVKIIFYELVYLFKGYKGNRWGTFEICRGKKYSFG